MAKGGEGNIPVQGQAAFSAVLQTGEANQIVVPGGDFLLNAEFERSGPDLTLVGADGTRILVQGYFADSTPPDLVTSAGAVIEAGLAAKLAGSLAPGQYAQNGGSSAAAIIGKVSVLAGKVMVKHADGTKTELKKGDAILKDDVLDTDKSSSVGITFEDGTTFSLGGSGRMVMDELVYDPLTKTGAGNIAVLKGAFSFVSGQIPKSHPDALTIKTPVMTVGIRGTAGAGNTETIVLLAEKGGVAGELTVTTPSGQTLTINVPGLAASIGPGGSLVSVQMSPSQMQQFNAVINANPNAGGIAPSSNPNSNGNNETGGKNPFSAPADLPGQKEMQKEIQQLIEKAVAQGQAEKNAREAKIEIGQRFGKIEEKVKEVGKDVFDKTHRELNTAESERLAQEQRFVDKVNVIGAQIRSLETAAATALNDAQTAFNQLDSGALSTAVDTAAAKYNAIDVNDADATADGIQTLYALAQAAAQGHASATVALQAVTNMVTAAKTAAENALALKTALADMGSSALAWRDESAIALKVATASAASSATDQLDILRAATLSTADAETAARAAARDPLILAAVAKAVYGVQHDALGEIRVSLAKAIADYVTSHKDLIGAETEYGVTAAVQTALDEYQALVDAFSGTTVDANLDSAVIVKLAALEAAVHTAGWDGADTTTGPALYAQNVAAWLSAESSAIAADTAARDASTKADAAAIAATLAVTNAQDAAEEAAALYLDGQAEASTAAAAAATAAYKEVLAATSAQLQADISMNAALTSLAGDLGSSSDTNTGTAKGDAAYAAIHANLALAAVVDATHFSLSTAVAERNLATNALTDISTRLSEANTALTLATTARALATSNALPEATLNLAEQTARDLVTQQVQKAEADYAKAVAVQAEISLQKDLAQSYVDQAQQAVVKAESFQAFVDAENAQTVAAAQTAAASAATQATASWNAARSAQGIGAISAESLNGSLGAGESKDVVLELTSRVSTSGTAKTALDAMTTSYSGAGTTFNFATAATALGNSVIAAKVQAATAAMTAANTELTTASNLLATARTALTTAADGVGTSTTALGTAVTTAATNAATATAQSEATLVNGVSTTDAIAAAKLAADAAKSAAEQATNATRIAQTLAQQVQTIATLQTQVDTEIALTSSKVKAAVEAVTWAKADYDAFKGAAEARALVDTTAGSAAAPADAADKQAAIANGVATLNSKFATIEALWNTWVNGKVQANAADPEAFAAIKVAYEQATQAKTQITAANLEATTALGTTSTASSAKGWLTTAEAKAAAALTAATVNEAVKLSTEAVAAANEAKRLVSIIDTDYSKTVTALTLLDTAYTASQAAEAPITHAATLQSIVTQTAADLAWVQKQQALVAGYAITARTKADVVVAGLSTTDGVTSTITAAKTATDTAYANAQAAWSTTTLNAQTAAQAAADAQTQLAAAKAIYDGLTSAQKTSVVTSYYTQVVKAAAGTKALADQALARIESAYQADQSANTAYALLTQSNETARYVAAIDAAAAKALAADSAADTAKLRADAVYADVQSQASAANLAATALKDALDAFLAKPTHAGDPTAGKLLTDLTGGTASVFNAPSAALAKMTTLSNSINTAINELNSNFSNLQILDAKTSPVLTDVANAKTYADTVVGKSQQAVDLASAMDGQKGVITLKAAEIKSLASQFQSYVDSAAAASKTALLVDATDDAPTAFLEHESKTLNLIGNDTNALAHDGLADATITITSLPNAGKLTLADGTTALTVGMTITATQAQTLLYTPSGNVANPVPATITDTLTYSLSRTGTVETLVNGTLISTPYSTSDTAKVTLTVTHENYAPTLTTTGAPATLTSVIEHVSSAANTGTLVSTLLGGRATDPEGATVGMALTSVVSTNGTWQYSTDSGTTWITVTGLDSTHHLLLAPTDKLRFAPTGYVNGTASFTYRAWDQSAGSGTAHTLVNATTAAGSKFAAFSGTEATGSITVTPDVHAPALAVQDTSVSTINTAVVLPLTVTAAADNDAYTVQISGVPATATLSAGTNNGGGQWTLQSNQLSGLTLTPPTDFNGDIKLNIKVIATDGGLSTSVSNSLTVSIGALTVAVDGIADRSATTRALIMDGGANADTIIGGSGDDIITGGAGSDTLTGGAGNDVVLGGDGDDLIVGGTGTGDDSYSGGSGTDTVKYSSAVNAVTVDLTTGTASGSDIDSDILDGIENVIGGSGADTITGSAGANSLAGGSGNDTLTGLGGSDTLTGGDGADVFHYTATAESDGSNTDTITDFVSGTDTLDLTGSNGYGLLHGAYTFNSSAADTAADIAADPAIADSLVFFTDDTDGWIYIKGDGSAGTSFDGTLIKLAGVTQPPAAADFVQTVDEYLQASVTDITTDEDTATSGIITVDYSVTGDTLSYDFGLDGSDQPITSVTTTYGTATIDATTGAYTFTPGTDDQSLASGDSATDTFQVYAREAGGATSAKTVTVTLAGVNDAPTVTSVMTTASGTEDTLVTFTADHFTALFQDVEGNSAVEVKITALPTSGILALLGTPVTLDQVIAVGSLGDLTFQPADNDTASVDFSWTVSDGTAFSADSVTTTMSFAGTNDAPVVSEPVALTSSEDTVITITTAQLLGTTTDVDGDTLTVSDLSSDSGSVVADGNGDYLFTPSENFSGTVAFTYTVSDGNGETVTATANLSVAPVNDAPTLSEPNSSGLAFSGGSHVAVADSPSLNVETGYTIEFRAKLSDVINESTLLEKGLWQGSWMIYTAPVPGGVVFAAASNSWNFPSNNFVAQPTSTLLQADTWYHFAATWDGTTSKLYVNGGLEANEAPSGDLLPNAGALTIGARSGGSYPTTGTLRDVQIWNTVRSEAEILADVTTRPTGNETGLVGYWPLNENSGTTAADASGNNNSGVLTGDPTWDTGVAEDAVLSITGIAVSDVDSQASDDVQVTLSAGHGGLTLTTTDGLTLDAGGFTNAATVTFTGSRTAVNTALETLSYKGNKDYSGPDQVTITANDLGGGAQTVTKTLDIAVSAVNDAPTISSLGTAMVAFNVGDSPVAVVQDSVIISDVDATSFTQVVVSITGGDWGDYLEFVPTGAVGYDGDLYYNVGADWVMGGSIFGGTYDDPMVITFTEAASAAVVQDVLRSVRFGSDSTLSGTRTLNFTVTDDQGAESGVISRIVNFDTGEIAVLGANQAGGSLEFDGIDDYAQADATTLAVGTGDFTMEAMINPTASDGVILSKDKDGATSQCALMMEGGHLKFVMADGTNSITLASSSFVTLDSWSHVAVTRTGSHFELYLNGQFVASTDGSGTIDMNASDLLVVGGRLDSSGVPATGQAFKGQIDNVRLWDVTRTGTEIEESYRLKAPVDPDPHLVANWTMDTLVSGAVPDANGGPALTLGANASASANDPQRINPPGHALDFNGGYVTLANAAITPTMTVEAWVRPDAFSNTVNDFTPIFTTGTNGTPGSLSIGYTNAGLLTVTYVDANCVSSSSILSTSALQAQAWNHVAVVFNANEALTLGSVDLYVDGTLVGGATGLPVQMEGTRSAAYVGFSQTMFDGSFQGQMAELRIWDQARTAADINNNMNVRLSGDEFGLVANMELGDSYMPYGNAYPITHNDAHNDEATYADGQIVGGTLNVVTKPSSYSDTLVTREDTPIESKLLAVDANAQPLTYSADGGQPQHGSLYLQQDGNFSYHPDDDFVGTDTFTVSVRNDLGNVILKTLTVTVTAVDDPVGAEPPPATDHGALNLHGSTALFLTEALATGTSDVTYEAWVRMDSTSSLTEQFILSAGGEGTTISLSMYNGMLRANVNGMQMYATTSADATSWHHVAAQLSNDAGIITARLFLDGNAAGQQTFGGTYDISGTTAYIGRGLSDAVGSEGYLQGKLSDIRVYTEARSLDDIRADMMGSVANGTNLLARWGDSQEDGAILVDVTGHGYNGAFLGTNYGWGDRVMAVTTAGTALQLDGLTIDDLDTAPETPNVPAIISVSLHADHGTLHVADLTGVTVVSGANDSSALVFTGSQTALNTVLANVSYTPANGFSGRDSLTVLIDEMNATVTRKNGGTLDIVVLSVPTAYADSLIGSDSVDVIDALAGNDIIDGRNGADTLTGGAGADTLTGGLDADKFLYTAATDSTTAAPDTITDFGWGTDVVKFEGMAGISYDQWLSLPGLGVSVTTVSATVAAIDAAAGISDAIVFFTVGMDGYLYVKGDGTGTSFDGTLIKMANSAMAPSASDIQAGIIYGTSMMDVMTGTSAPEMFMGGMGRDTIDGVDGNDVLVGQEEGDILTGGAGADTFRYTTAMHSSRSDSDVITDFQTGVDRIELQGATGLSYFPDAYPVLGATPADTAMALSTSANITNRVVFFTQDNDGYLYVSGAMPAQGFDDMLIKLSGVTVAPSLADLPGLLAATGLVVEGTFNGDILTGGVGDDTLIGGSGTDELTGGSGADVFRFASGMESNSSTTDIITDFNVGQGDRISVPGIDGMTYDAIAYSPIASTPNDIMMEILADGSTANKAVFFTDGTNGYLVFHGYGTSGNSMVDGLFIRLNNVTTPPPLSALDGLLTHAGTFSYDALTGTSGIDVIGGGAGNDEIWGVAGNDTLIGGQGADTLSGGAGNDLFRLNSSTDSDSTMFDTITDFTTGEDKVQLNGAGTLSYDASLYPLVGANASMTATTIQADAGINDRIVFFVQDGDGYLYVKTVKTIGSYDNTLIKLAGVTTPPTLADLAGVVAATGVTVSSNAGSFMTGTSLADHLATTMGYGTIYGLGGDDVLASTMMGNASLIGGAGADSLSGSQGVRFVYTAKTDSCLAGGIDLISGLVDNFQAIQFTGMAGIDYSQTVYPVGDESSPAGVVSLIEADGTVSNSAVFFTLNGLGYLYVKGAGSGVDFSGTLISVANHSSPFVYTDLLGVNSPPILGTSGDDYLVGTMSNELLSGLDGNDALFANSGNDTLIGGDGSDSLTGDMGNDVFRYTANTQSTVANCDTINGFGSDVIEFSGMDGMAYDASPFTFSTDVATTIANITSAADIDDQVVFFTNNMDGWLYVKGAGTGTSFDGTLIKLANKFTAPSAAELSGPVSPGYALDAGGQLILDGVDDAAQATGILLDNQSFSWEFWANRENSAANDIALGQGTAGTNTGLAVGYLSGTTFTFSFFNNDLNYNDFAGIPGEWAHWAGTYDAATNVRILYKNGMEVMRDYPAVDFQGTGPLVIGDTPWNGNHFGGQLDDIRIWNTTRTAQQIADNFDRSLTGDEIGLTANWTFDALNGFEAEDITGHDNALVFGAGDMAPMVTNVPGMAALFTTDGANIQTGAASDQLDNITLEAWARQDSQDSNPQVIAYTGNTSTTGWGLMLDGTGHPMALLGGVEVLSASSVTITPDAWHHYALVRNGGTWSLYVDGVAAPLDGDVTSTPNAISETTYIGGTPGYAAQSFIGAIADVRLWGVARSQNDVLAHMNERLTGVEAGLAGYWRLDDNQFADSTATSVDSVVHSVSLVDTGPVLTAVTGPAITDDVLETAANAPLNGQLVSENTTTWTVQNDQATDHGTVTVAADGTFTYTPIAGFSGSDSFTVTATTAGIAATQLVTVEVKADTLMVGGSGGDVLTGGASNDQLIGGGGADTLSGGAGDDVLMAVAPTAGTKLGDEFLINTATANSQWTPSVTALADGGFVVVWDDESATGDDLSVNAVRGQRYNADGTAAGDEFLVNTTTYRYQYQPKVTALAGGGFAVTWRDDSYEGGDTTGASVRAQVYAADGSKTGTEFVVNTTTIGDQHAPAIVGLTDGGFLVAWRDNSAGSDYIKAQAFDAVGAKVGSEFLVSTHPSINLSMVTLADGSIVMIWDDNSTTIGDTSYCAVHGQRYNADLTVAGSEFLVNTTTTASQYQSTTTALEDGGFVVAWRDESYSGADTFGLAIRAQRFSADGSKLGSEFLVNTTIVGNQHYPSIIALKGGGFMVAWADDNEGAANNIHAQEYDSSGTKVGEEFAINTTTPNDQTHIALAQLADGRIVATWADSSQLHGDISGFAVRGQILAGVSNVYLDGGADDDILAGGQGNDVLTGGDGNDILGGGQGHDTLTGGNGADTFLFSSKADSPGVVNGVVNLGTIDVVQDFTSGSDKVILEGINGIGFATYAGLAGTSAADLQTAITNIQANPGTYPADTAYFMTAGGQGYLYVNGSGSGVDYDGTIIQLNNCTSMSAADFTPGEVRTASDDTMALHFDGSDGRVLIPSTQSAMLEMSHDFTIETWINTTDDNALLFFKDAGTTQNWEPNGKVFAILYGALYFDSYSIGSAFGTTQINDGQWHHLAVTFTDTSDEVRLYVDGQLDGAATIPLAPDNPNHMVKFGKDLTGDMAEMRFWDVARSQSEIADDRFSTLQGDEDSLVGYWNFEGGTGNTVLDQTSNSLNGTLEGFSAPQYVASTAPISGGSLTGGDGDDTLTGSSGGDIIHGGAGADIITGLAGDDWIGITGTTATLLDGGSGVDALVWEGANGTTFDLANMAGLIQGFEAIDLSAAGTQTLIIDAQDVLSLADSTNALTNGSADTLVIMGASDSVQLTGGTWTAGSTNAQLTSNDGHSYSVYSDTSTGAQVYVDNTVSVTLP